MWHWQLNEFNVSCRFRFFIQLLLVSAIAHCGFFALVTIAYQVMGRKIFHMQIHAKLSNNGARIVFRPFVQPVQQKKIVHNTNKIISKKIKNKQKAKPKAKTIKTALQTRAKKLIKEIVQKKAPKPVAKKIVAQELQQKVQPQKKEIQYINQKELEALHVQTKIQQLIYKLWKPPIGLSKELACTISATVDANGYISSTTISKSSGVLIYDIAARSAVAQLATPAVACNQSFSITFKQ